MEFSEQLNLHQVWDGKFFDQRKFTDPTIVANAPQKHALDIKFSLDGISTRNKALEIVENIALETARDVTCSFAYWSDDLGRNQIRKGMTLGQEYSSGAKIRATDQMIRAGIRLASLLTSIITMSEKLSKGAPTTTSTTGGGGGGGSGGITTDTLIPPPTIPVPPLAPHEHGTSLLAPPPESRPPPPVVTSAWKRPGGISRTMAAPPPPPPGATTSTLSTRPSSPESSTLAPVLSSSGTSATRTDISPPAPLARSPSRKSVGATTTPLRSGRPYVISPAPLTRSPSLKSVGGYTPAPRKVWGNPGTPSTVKATASDAAGSRRVSGTGHPPPPPPRGGNLAPPVAQKPPAGTEPVVSGIPRNQGSRRHRAGR